MTTKSLTILVGTIGILALPMHAGTMITPGKDEKKIETPLECPVHGTFTLGYEGSDRLESGYLDGLTPLWTPGTAALFYNGRTSIYDDQQSFSSYGAVFRYRVPNQDIIFGVNAYYDSIESQNGRQYDEFGIGAELMTHWVDARFNYYLPDMKRERVYNSHDHQDDIHSDPFNGGTLTTETTINRNLDRFESPLEGLNAEVGFLIPGLENYEVRAFAGYYHYLNPFGTDYDGFKARMEAHITHGIVAGVEYWDDAKLTGGHWTGEVSATLPFTLGNIFRGKNPFEGASEAFKTGPRDFCDRMSDMVVRSHRIKTTTSSLTAGPADKNVKHSFSGGGSNPTPGPQPQPSPSPRPTQPPKGFPGF
jgi:hypothetical protein